MAANEPADPVKTESGESEAAPAASASPDKPQRKRRLDVNPSLILSTEGRSKRRRTPTPPPGGGKAGADPKEVERAKTLGMVIYNKIMNLHDQSGESMADPFVKLPNKRQFPDYYETIKHPMSLEIIHQKLEASAYSSLFDVISDFGQMWNNAKRYNVKESTLFQWARKMHKITRTFYNNHTAGENSSESEDEPLPPPPPRPVATPAQPARAATATSVSAAPSPSTAGPSTPAGDSVLPKAVGPGTGKKRGSYMKDGPTVYKLIKPAMRDIKAAKSNDGQQRDIATIFLTLPDRKSFPDYYRTIKNPVSLDEIEHRMITRRYHSSEEFFVEVERMCDNAMLYNEDESEVWRDARQIRDIVAHHREQVKERLAQPFKAGGAKMPTKTVTPVRHGSQQSPHVPAAGIPGIGIPQPLPPGMHVPPEMRGAYASHSQYTALPPGYAQQQQQQQLHSPAPAQAQAPASYLPQLPHGVVTEEVVATLDRYPAYEQQAWMSTLPPLALNIYRQMAAANEARKRGVPPPAPAVEQRSTAPPAPEPVPVTPTIKAIDFAYSDTPAGSTATSPDEKAADKKPVPASLSAAIRLHNMRGVATHAVAIASATSEVELTAWVNVSDSTTSESKPEVTLRVNGTTAVDTPKLLYGKENTEQPAGLRWTVPISPARVEFKIEFVATKPGAHAETSAIFINRQF